MRINQLLRKKRLPDDLFSPKRAICLQDDISQHAAFLYHGIFRRHYGNQAGSRRLHGIAHMSRVSIYIQLLTMLYNKYFLMALTDEDKKLLQLAALLHDSGREGDSEDLWDKDSAELLYYYLTVTLKVSQEKAVIFAEAIANKDYKRGETYFNLIVKNDEISWSDEPLAQKEKTVIQELLHDADCFDIIRARKSFYKTFLVFYNKVAIKDASALEEISKFEDAVCQLLLLERSYPKIYNSEFTFGKILIEISKNPNLSFFKKLYGEEKLNEEVKLIELAHEFQLPYIGKEGEIALRILAEKIKFPEQKIWIEKFIKKYAVDGLDSVVNFLENIKSLSIEEIIENEKRLLDQKAQGRLFKYVRADFWDDFADSLVDPENFRPGVNAYKDLRKEGKRKAFTIRLNNGEYEIVSTDKILRPSLHGEEKKKHTKHQSTSFANDEAAYNPVVFRQGTREVQVGVSFDPDDCIIQRILVYENGTFGRPYDFDTEDEAKAFLEQKLKAGLMHKSLLALQENELKHSTNRTNEIMAGFQWTTRSSVTVFTDNLESRLLAQLRALDLKNRFEAHSPGVTVIVPINIYPGFIVYDSAEQAEDFKAAEKDGNLKKYTVAINLLSGVSDDKLIDNIEDIRIICVLLKEVNSKFSIALNGRIDKVVKQKADIFFTTLKDKEALFLQWLSSEKLKEFNSFSSILRQADFAKNNDEAADKVLQLLKDMDFFLDRIQTNKSPSDDIDSLEKLKIFLIKNKNITPKDFDIKKKFSELVKTKEDILYVLNFPNLQFFEVELIKAVNACEFSNALREIIINSKRDIGPLLVAAKESVILSISDLFQLIESRFNHVHPGNSNPSNEDYRQANQNSKLAKKIFYDREKLSFEKTTLQGVYENFMSLIASPDDFIKIHFLLDNDSKNKIEREFSKKIDEWVSSVQDFSKIYLQCKEPSIKKIFFDVIKNKISDLVGNSIENFNCLCISLTLSERKEVYGLLPKNWLVDNVTFAKDFVDIEKNLDIDVLKDFLNSDRISKKTALEFFGSLCENKNLKSSSALVSLILSHEKTKALIERTWNAGDFIDLTHENPECLAIVLASDYYKTEDGIRALNAALIRFSGSKRTVQVIKNVLEKSPKPLRPVTRNVSLDEHFSTSQIYNLLTSLFADFAKIELDGELRLNKIFYSSGKRTFWMHSVLNDQGAEIGRLIVPSSRDNPQIIYYPGTDGQSREGIPLIEIKKFVDKKIQESCPDLDLSKAMGHYVLIDEKNGYIAGIGYQGHLDVQEVVDQNSVVSAERYKNFQEITDCTECSCRPYLLPPEMMHDKRYQNIAVEMHARALGFSDSRRCAMKAARGVLCDDSDDDFDDDCDDSKEISYSKNKPEFYMLIEVELPKYPSPTGTIVNPVSVSKVGVFSQANEAPVAPTNTQMISDNDDSINAL